MDKPTVSIAELKALHPESEVIEFDLPPRFLIVIRPSVDPETMAEFNRYLRERGVETVIVCFGNANANPNDCISGQLLEGM